MKHAGWILIAVLAMACGSLQAQQRIYPPLAIPLQLPETMTETLPLNKTGSFFGDAFRVVDCTDAADLPYGTCGNQLYGGLVMADAHLNGSITIKFFPPVNNIAHFEVTNGTLNADENVAVSPAGFLFPMIGGKIMDSPNGLSSGDLDLTTGAVSNLNYEVLIGVSGLTAIHYANPNFSVPADVSFPGIEGYAWIQFDQRPDGLLDFTFQGSTFGPFGADQDGEEVRFITPVCTPDFHCASVPARGFVAHPHLYLSTREPGGRSCDDHCPNIPFNTIQEYTLDTYYSGAEDDFNLDSGVVGGPAVAQTHLQGRLQIQFGPRNEDTVYFVITSLVPEALLAAPPPSPISLPGLLPSLVGQEEIVNFPLLSYRVQRFAVADDPYSFPQGAINLRTGRVIGNMSYPGALTANIPIFVYLENPGRVGFPFQFVAQQPPPGAVPTTYGLFESGVNGETVFRFSGDFPSTFAQFVFPRPDFSTADAFFTGPTASLDINFRLQAMHPADTPVAVKTGGATNLVSSVGDVFSYSYSIPCNPAGAPFAFQYTNLNPGQFGGTFQMNRLASVRCLNSRSSTLSPGNYDTVTFSGFGTWSKDPPNSTPRFTTVQISTAPDAPYVGILVYMQPDANSNVILSGAHTPPATLPLP